MRKDVQGANDHENKWNVSKLGVTQLNMFPLNPTLDDMPCSSVHVTVTQQESRNKLHTINCLMGD